MNQNPVQEKTLEEIKKHIGQLRTLYDPPTILREAEKKLNTPESAYEDEDGPDEPDDPNNITSYSDPLFQAMTLSEFENGVLLTQSVPEQFRTFGVNMLRQLQKEYDCKSIGEQSLAELATLAYIKVLELQQILHKSLAREEKYQINITYISVVGKELDRANRQFLAAIQALITMKRPQIGINIKAQTAVLGQNQVVQSNNNT